MEEQLYRKFYEVETSHWWFSTRQKIIGDMIKRKAALRPSSKILDVGCGTGAILAMLSTQYEAWGTDTSPIAIEYCRKRGIANAFCCTLETFPHPEMRFDLITMFDVIEHIDDDIGVLRQARQLLKAGGKILVTVPAYEFLWSIHDDLNHHKRRFVRSQLRKVLEASGFNVELISYYNTILFPSAVVQRITKKFIMPATDTTLNIPALWLNSLLGKIFSFERILLKRFSLPFGLSLIAVARKDDQS
jgi:2-polyprenyl-3-methyl-5-hydroxy-6-metoxy-1,4-benzoquinol methylase